MASDARKLLLLLLYYTGVIHEYPAEQEAIDFAVNNTSGLNDVAIFLKRFNDIDNITLFHQGKTMRWI